MIPTLILVLMVALAGARGIEVKRRVGELEAEIRIDRNPPALGDNNFEIELKDPVGKPLTEAKVLVNYYMPPMPRMAPMNYTTDAKLKGEVQGDHELHHVRPLDHRSEDNLRR